MEIFFRWRMWRLRFDTIMIRDKAVIWVGPVYISVLSWTDLATIIGLISAPWVWIAIQ